MDTPESAEFTKLDTWRTGYHDGARIAILILTDLRGRSVQFAMPADTAGELGAALNKIAEDAASGRAQQHLSPPS